MTRATWRAATADGRRDYQGRHRAETTRSGILVIGRRPKVFRRFGRGLARPLVAVGAMAAGLVLGVAELLPDRWWLAPLPLAILVAAAWWVAVAAAAVFGGLWPAVGTGLAGVWLLAMVGLAVPSGWWRR